MSCAVILTALQVEYLAVRAHLTDVQEEMHEQGTIYERGYFVTEHYKWEVGIVEVGAGNTGAALEAERAIAYFKPDVIFFVGLAGGIQGVSVGDVIASTKIYGYESGKSEEKFKPRPELGLAAYSLEQRARAEARREDWLQRLFTAPKSSPTVFVAPIAAGEKVVTSTRSEVCQFLKTHYEDAIAVEMEGLGFLGAARANQNVSAIVIRGISTLLDDECNGNGHVKEAQEIASRHAGAFTFQVLSKFISEQPCSAPQESTTDSVQRSVLASVMPDVTFEDIEFVIKALLEHEIPTKVVESVDFTLTNPKEKMSKNHLTRNIRFLLDLGLAKAREVHHLIETIVRSYFPDVPDRLKLALNKEYQRLAAEGLQGDDLFRSLYDFTSCRSSDEAKRAAGLAVLCYFFERCDVFEP